MARFGLDKTAYYNIAREIKSKNSDYDDSNRQVIIGYF